MEDKKILQHLRDFAMCQKRSACDRCANINPCNNPDELAEFYRVASERFEQLDGRENEMTLNQYQKLAARTINENLTHDQKLAHALHEIASEVGEIHGIYQKALQGHPFDFFELKKEIGDLMWGIGELCTVYGLTLEEVAAANIEKLAKRYPDGFSEERSIHREEEK